MQDDNIMKTIIEAFSEEFETQKGNAWVEAHTSSLNVINEFLHDLHDKTHSAIYTAQELGFIEGMNFALQISNATTEQSDKVKTYISALLKGV